MLASVDIPFCLIEKAYKDSIEKKEQGVCKIVPRSRFILIEDDWSFSGLVCSPNDMYGKSTGVGVRGCQNCVREEE